MTTNGATIHHSFLTRIPRHLPKPAWDGLGRNRRFSFQSVARQCRFSYNSVMKLTVKVKLLPSDDQRQRLKQTLETANAACNWISQQAWESQTFGRVPLHKQTYYPVRQQLKLSTQLAVRCIAKV